MHFERALFAPVILIFTIVLSLFILRRKISGLERKLESLRQWRSPPYLQDPDSPGDVVTSLYLVPLHRPSERIWPARKKEEVRELEAELAHFVKIRCRAMRLLGVNIALFLLMLAAASIS